MRKLLFFLSLSILMAAPAFAEELMSKARVWETPAKREDSAYSEKAAAFYKKDAEYRNTAFTKRTALLQKLTAIQGKKLSSTNPEEQAKLEAEIVEASNELGKLIEDISKHEVESAELGVEIAKDRLDRAKKSLAFIQEQNKKPS